MNEVAYTGALGLAVVFAWAGAAKIGARARTARSFRALGLPAAFATIVPIVELVVALGLVVVPGVAAAGATALLLAFTAVLVRAADDVPCACFGTARTEPVSWVEISRNGALLALALATAVARTTPTVPGLAALLVGGTGAAILAVLLALADLKRRTGAVLALQLP